MDLTYDRTFRAAEDLELDPEFGELQIAEYIVFLLALDTYMRYLDEASGEHGSVDDMATKGLRLLRIADNLHIGAIGGFLGANLPSETHKKMLEKALRLRPTTDGASRRALQIRTILSRGGAGTMRAVFQTNKALQAVRTAIGASMVDDADAALDKFAAIPVKNIKIRDWIDDAAKFAGSGVAPNPVAAATKSTVADDTSMLSAQKMRQEAAALTSDENNEAEEAQSNILSRVQAEAEQTAKKAIETSGGKDLPPTRSEVVGIATAAAVAALSDPGHQQNVPASLKSLDAEQRAAALTDGKVLVAAGAGSGKSTTLTSRVAYLVQERKVNPAKIFVISFNAKAAKELREKIATKVGDEALNDMTVGTMHSTFKRFVVEYGTPEEKAALTTWLMTPSRGGNNGRSLSKAPSPAAFAGFMARVWKECFGEDPPRKTGTVVQKWMMNNVSPDKAKEQASGKMEIDQAEWYRWTLGFKGSLKGWAPPCVRSNDKAAKAWGDFLSKWRDGGRARLGTFEDMILMFRDLLQRDPTVRKKVQSMYDHVLVDEAQDLNEAQHSILEMMTEHITDGQDGKSTWIVGDVDQSINLHVGARPELFAQFHNKEGWKTRTIGTNYRCMPEIVEAANTLLGHHPEKMPRNIRPDSKKPRGMASIVVNEPRDHASGAVSVVAQIGQDVEAGSALSDYAVLSRTNMELNDYETACIISGVPYARKGGSSFLRSPETVTVMSYFNLVVGNDYERMQKSLIEVLNKPNRFFLRAGESERIINEAVQGLARRKGIQNNALNPLDLFTGEGLDYLLRAMDPQRRNPSWKTDKDMEHLNALGDALYNMREAVEKPGYTTQKLLGDILAIPGVGERGKPAPTLRETLMPSVGGHEEEGDAPPDPNDDESKKPIGNVQFLYQIAQPDPANPEIDPSDPRKFKAKIDKFVQGSKELRVNLDEWDSEQQKLPENQRQKPPCVVLSTVHSTKGAQWPNTTVVMTKGIFPFEPKRDPKEDNLPPEAQERLEKKREEEFLTERQLAYVAMTRAAKSLTIMCPRVSAYGREGGISRFVGEAGLKVGQNVEGKNDTMLPEIEPKTMLARFMVGPPQGEDLYAEPSYDRRRRS